VLSATAAWSQVGVRQDGDRLIVQNERVSVALSQARHGALVSLADRASDREFAAARAEPFLFRLVFTETGDISGTTQTFSNRDAARVLCEVERTADAERAVLRFSEFAARSLRVTCTVAVANGDPLVRWRIAVAGSEPLVLEEVQYPIFGLSDTLGSVRDDDGVLAGATEDGLYLAPGDWPPGRQHVYTQPGSLAAQFGGYYDPAGGVYTATQDGKGYPKRLAIVREAADISVAWSHLCHAELPQPFALTYDVVCTTFRGTAASTPTDWRDAADLHKQWALTQPWCARTVAQRQDIPDWIRRGTVRLQWDLRTDGPPKAAADWVAQHWDTHFASLPPFVTFFGFEHTGSWVAPKYVPFYPSDEEFVAAARRIRDLGGHVFLFPSSYQWSLTYNRRADGVFEWDDHADFEARGRAHAILDRDGSVSTRAHSWLNGGESAALCRGDAWSRQFLCDTVAQLLARGVDVVQMDQVVGGQWPAGAKTPCFSPDHGHPPGHGLWDAEAYHAQMRALRERCDRLGPGTVFSQESPQELFVQDFGLFDYRHARANVNVKPWDRVPKAHAAVFPYLYNEFVPVFHIPSHSEPVAVILAHGIVSGEIPSFKPGQVEFPGDPMVRNGRFGTWTDAPVDWRIWRSHPQGTATASRDTGASAAGECSLRLDGRQDDESVQAYQCIPVDGTALSVGGAYRVRLRMRAAELAGKAGLDVEALDSPDWQVWKRLGTWTVNAPTVPGWAESAVELTVPAGTQVLRLVLRLSGRGTVWFDGVRLEGVRADGSVEEMVRPGNAVFRMLQQWAQLAAAGAGRYVMQGTMLHPPPLRVGMARCFVSAPQASALSFQVYALEKDHSRSGGYASCPLTIAPGDGRWEQKSLELSLKPGAAELHVPLDLRQQGELLFDDFELTEVGTTGNVMRNAGFEQWPDPLAPPPGWQRIEEYQGRRFTGSFRREAQDTHSGAFAIRLVNAAESDEVHVKQVLPVDGAGLVAGKTYRVRFWVKVRHVARWRPVRVEQEFPAILHNAFRAPDGHEAVLLVNATDRPQAGALTWGGTQAELALSPWEVRLIEDRR